MVITGVGAVGAFGAGAPALAAAWRRGALEPVEVDRSAGYHRPGGARRALRAIESELTPLLAPAQARRMSPPARMAVAASRLALVDAGLADLDRERHRDTAIVAGTAFGPAAVTELLLAQIFAGGPETASPALFTESVASASAAQLALALGARGPNLAITQREASDLYALAEGVRLVASGAVERALVVAVDEIVPMLHAVLGRFRALARPDAGDAERALPLGAGRAGALAAEGATALVLESESSAGARGRPPLATVTALARGFDASAPAWDYGDGGAALAGVLARALERAGVGAETLDAVATGASGARRGDRLEAAVLRRIFADAPPPLVAPKALLGGWGGGHLAASVLLAAGRLEPRPLEESALDPELGLTPRPAAGSPRRWLVSSLASGGAAAWAVLDGRRRSTP